MAHVVIAEDDPVCRHLYTLMFEAEGHQVTAPDDFWGVLATLRSVLHPVVCLYHRDLEMRRHLLGDEERMAALEANRADLRRHRYIGIGWKPGPLLVPQLAAIEDGLQVEVLHQPVHLQVLADTVLRIAEQLPD